MGVEKTLPGTEVSENMSEFWICKENSEAV